MVVIRPPSRLAPFALSLGLAALGCGRHETSSIELQVGRESFHFVPQSAFAEYWELPGQGDLLRLSLASYATTCARPRPPEEGEILVVLTLRSPIGKPLALGEYAWAGLAANPAIVEGPDVLPFVRLAREGRLLDPGGSLDLRRIERQMHGVVETTFSFSRPPDEGGEAETGGAPPPTSTLRGSASLRLCRVSLDAARKTSDAGVLRP